MQTNDEVLVIAELAAEMLNLKVPSVLDEVLEGEGIGRTGKLPEAMTLRDCAELVKKRFQLPNVKVFGELNKIIRTAAISPGAGKSMVQPALAAVAEVLIS